MLRSTKRAGMASQLEPQTDQPAPLGAPWVTTHGNGVTIRPMRDTPEDRDFAAEKMVEAFEGKLVNCVTREKLPITQRLTVSFYRGQAPYFYARNFVAEVDGRPVGLMMLKFKGDKWITHMDGICDLGCWHACRFACFGYAMDFKVNSREKCLVDTLGVDASCRGRGVGKALLDRADEEARKEGCKMMYLIVLTNNRAVHLYERHGYRIKTTVNSCSLRWSAGPPGAYYVMEKEL